MRLFLSVLHAPQVEATAQAREAASFAGQEAQLEAARSREHDALEQAEAQWRHTHHGVITRKEQQACAWHVHGMCMACAWRVHGMCMACAWGVHGACAWRMCMAYAWHVHGMCIACAWHVHGICMVCAWHVSGKW